MMDAHVRDLLSAYLDDELASDERAQVDAHLPSCADCSSLFEGLRATLAEMRALPEPEPRGADSIALRAAIARARSRPARMWGALGALGGAAAVVVAFVAFSGTPATDSPFEAALAPENSMAASTLDYDQASARALLDGYSLQGETGPAIHGAQEDATLGRGKAADEAIAWSAVLTRCEKTILEGTTDRYDRINSFAARYEGTPALFLIYSVGDPADRRELWVMSESCDVLLFEQARA